MFTHRQYLDMMIEAQNALTDAQFSLDTELFLKATADETSLLFATPEELDGFKLWAIQSGLECFNTVDRDRMVRLDKGATEGFDVRFEFMRLPGAAGGDWRIEAMCVLGGQAPLHEEHLAAHGTGKPVHVSFKCEDENRYRVMKRTMADDGFQSIPFHAEYQNSYGRFSYWGVGPWYLKPRVNLRDAAQPLV